MEAIKLTIPHTIEHLSQIITGFLILGQQGWPVELEDVTRDAGNPYHGLPILLAQYRGQRIVYDLWDGYNDLEGMGRGLENCDFYFKRSFSQEKNQTLFPEFAEKIYPLGFNYHLSYPGDPIQEPKWKALAKPLLGRTPDKYFVPEVFEGKAEEKIGEPVKILFLTRLWNNHDPSLSEAVNEERRLINESRIEIIRTLRSRYGDAFFGGLNNTALSRTLAPELIVPAQYTERKKYLKLVHDCDICIGTMGLHESIGWKTGEYVAAAKAIVHETFHYSVPGDFAVGRNYLSFTTAEECISAVQRLVDSPKVLYSMKQANEDYYRRFLKPEVLVKNTLETIDCCLALPEKNNHC